MIPPARWERVKDVLGEALGLAADRRAAFLEQACGEDAALRREVDSLIAAHDGAGGFLDEFEPRMHDHAPDAAPLDGRSVGPYRLVASIGSGGMGEVYRALRDDDQFQKVVAVKLVRGGIESESLLRRFRAERQILARLEHPGIARLLDGGATEDGRPYLVMEHVEGTRIDQWVRAQRLDTHAILVLFRTVCAAVQYAHQNLIVHRDIKPANILVARDGVPKLLDFGIAKLLDPDAPETTVTAAALMTPAYASPEQVRGEPITTASDVYSLGVVLYELLTGSRPYRLAGDTPLDLQRAICEQEPERPSTAARRPTAEAPPPRLRRSVAGDLDTIVLKALRKEAHRRYPSVQQFSDDIGRLLEGRPVRARKDTLSYRASRFVRRHALAVAATVALCALGAGFVANMAVQARRVAKERDKAEKVSAFLVDLFRVSDPYREGEPGAMTARDMLDRGAAHVQRDLQAQPEVRAALMDTIGRIYGNLGMYDKAAPLLNEALGTRRRLYGPEHHEVASTLANLANVMADRGESDVAEAFHREALAIRRRLLGSDHLEVARSLNDLATVMRDQGDQAAAEALHREALGMRRRLLGDDHLDVARSLNNLANVLLDKGDLAGAEALHREALAAKRRLLGNDHHDVATSLNNLAAVYYLQDDYPRAEALYREILPAYRRLLGNAHPDVAMCLDNLGVVRMRQGDYPGAEALHREGLAMRRTLLGGEHRDVSDSMNNLAIALRHQGRREEAEGLYRQALEIRLKDPDESLTAETLSELGELLLQRGAAAEAEPLLRRALDTRRKDLPHGRANHAETQSALGACLVALGRHQEAEPLLIESYSVLADRPARARARGEAAARLVRLYESWGRADRAAPYRSPRTTVR